MKYILLICVFLLGCSHMPYEQSAKDAVYPDGFDIHFTHDMHKVNGGFMGFSWDLE